MSVETFSKAVDTYEKHAHVQRVTAKRLSQLLHAHLNEQNNSSILEYGCGTGIMSRKLISQFPGSKFVFSDASKVMIQQLRLQEFAANAHSIQLQANETPGFLSDLIVSNMMIQWIDDLGTLFGIWRSALKTPGWLALSFPANNSFPEWKLACQKAGVKFTGRELPRPQDVTQSLVENGFELIEQRSFTFVQENEDVLSFFRDIKGVGAHHSIRSLSPVSFRKMIRNWQFSGSIASHTYHIQLLLARYEN